MSVTWTETPNDPSIPLEEGPFTTLHFTASNTIDHIAVDVGTGVEEVAYRDGAFRGFYEQYSSIDASQTVGALYRKGGWPAPPKVYTKTVPVPPVGSMVPMTGTASNTSGLVITLNYPSNVYEVVYQLGAFTPLYSAGSTINLGTGAYSILRAGGFPAGVSITTIGCAPCPPAPTTFWTTLYDKDLRTLPNQTVSASMSNTYINFMADGQPWCFHSSAASLMIVNGQGMVATVNGNSQSGNGYAGLFVALKLYQMTGWDPAKETAVQVRFSGNVIGSAISGAQVWGNRSEQWGYGPGDEAGVVRLDTVNGRTQWAYRPGAAGGDIIYPGGVPEDYNTLVFAITQQPMDTTAAGMRSGKKNYRAGYLRRQCDPNVWPSMESMPPMGAGYARTDIPLDYIKMGWYAGSASGDKTITATHIRVLQRPVV